MAAKMATIFGDVTGFQQRHQPQNILLLLRSKAFHRRQNHFEMLQHIKNSREVFHQAPQPSPTPRPHPFHLYHGGGLNLSVIRGLTYAKSKHKFYLVNNKISSWNAYMVQNSLTLNRKSRWTFKLFPTRNEINIHTGHFKTRTNFFHLNIKKTKVSKKIGRKTEKLTESLHMTA